MPDLASKIAAAREALVKATPGTWASGGDEVYAAKPYAVVCRMCDDAPLADDNADAISLAINALPALLDAVEALTAFRRASDVAWVTLAESPYGTVAEAEAEAALIESESAIDAALARLAELMP